MRRGILVLVMVLVMTMSAHADTVVNLYASGGTDTYGTVPPGGTFDFEVQLVNDTAMAGLRYDPLFPRDDWELVDFSYSPYGWLVNDGLFDSSVPKETDSYPIVVAPDLYDGAGADFHFESAQTGSGSLLAGTWTVADFSIRIPEDCPLDLYNISLDNPSAYDAGGDPVTITSGDAFDLDVVPEPGTLVLVPLGLGALAWWRKRQMA